MLQTGQAEFRAGFAGAGKADKRRAAIAIAVAFASLVACTKTEPAGSDSGGLAIVLESDMSIPADIDHVTLRVTQQGQSLLHVDSNVGAGALLIPSTFEIKGNGNAAPVSIQAVAYKGGQARVERDAVTPVPVDHVGELQLALNYLCVGTARTEADGGVGSTCPDGQTCSQGACVTSTVPASSLTTYAPTRGDAGTAWADASVPGGCFDVQTCFASATTVPVDRASCTAPLPAGASAATINVALQLPSGAGGVCGPSACWVVFDEGTDWTVKGSQIVLPAGACISDGAQGATLVVTTACTAKAQSVPECGAWSPVTMPMSEPPSPGGSSVVGTSCAGPLSQACGLCGTQTRTCSEGTLSAWSACEGEGVCQPAATESCGTGGTQTCASSCQWSACACPSDMLTCGAPGTCSSPGDVRTCGACGNDCASLPHVSGAATCAAGRCSIPASSCAPGFADCNGDPSDGCESSLGQPSHCGACGTACSGAASMCASSSTSPPQCASTCTGTVCGMECVETRSDISNCGACDMACNPAHAIAACVTGSCAVASCSAGYADCDGDAANGCEIETASDASHCGACGTVCSGGTTCQNGSCACPSGSHNCSGTCSSNTSINSCGSVSCTTCPVPTGGTATCDGTSCGTTCSTGETPCSGECVDEKTDGKNCGACAVACTGGETCQSSACACPSGSHICSGTCSSNTSVSSCGPTSCSACVAPTGGSATCNGTSCGTSCPAGESVCSNKCVNVSTDTSNCGKCGQACAGTCAGGTCTVTPRATALAAGADHVCALLSDGSVRCWGSNYAGQLGNGATTNSTTPVVVSNLSGVTAIAAGDSHTCALLSGGTVQCWGFNGSGQLGDGTSTGPSTCSTSGTSYACATTPVAVSSLSGVTAISAGGSDTCALVSGGAIECWGNNEYGELGNGTQSGSSTPAVVSSLSGATAISVGDTHACAVSGGAVKCWGDNEYGELGNGTSTGPSTCSGSGEPCATTPVAVSNLSGAVAIAAGDYHSCALVSGGTVQCWGWNDDGQLGDGTSTGPSTCNFLACSTTPVAVSGLSGAAVEIATGWDHSCALISGGAVQCWGDNDNGQLGNGTTTDASNPLAVSTLSGATALAANYEHTCTVVSGGVVECWGDDAYSELGNGTTGNSSTPVSVSW